MTRFDALSKEAVMAVNKKFNADGVRSDAELEHILYGVDKTRGINKKAAVLLMEIARRLPFVDGNKRTAVEAALAFLELNGKKLEISGSSKFNVVVWSVRPKTTVDEIAMWIANHTRF